MEKLKKIAKRGTRLHAVHSALATFFWRTSHELEAAPPPLCVPNVFLYSTLWTKAYHELESGQLDTQRAQCKDAPARASFRAPFGCVHKSSHGSRPPVAYRQPEHVAVAVKRMRETVRPGL